MCRHHCPTNGDCIKRSLPGMLTDADSMNPELNWLLMNLKCPFLFRAIQIQWNPVTAQIKPYIPLGTTGWGAGWGKKMTAAWESCSRGAGGKEMKKRKHCPGCAAVGLSFSLRRKILQEWDPCRLYAFSTSSRRVKPRVNQPVLPRPNFPRELHPRPTQIK